jgi:hypothetical protein
MGVPTSEVGYTSAIAGRGDHEVHKEHVALAQKNINLMLGNNFNKSKLYSGVN